MMHSNWLQVELKGLLGWPRREGVAWKFCKNQIETGRVTRETSEGKDKIESNKSTDLKGPSVTQLIMSIRRKYERGDMKRSKDRRVTGLGGNPSGLLILFKYLKVRSYRDFFPRKTCKQFACKRNYFVLQPETANLACWIKCYVEFINVIKWAMLNVNYFVFSCASLAVRVF